MTRLAFILPVLALAIQVGGCNRVSPQPKSYEATVDLELKTTAQSWAGFEGKNESAPPSGEDYLELLTAHRPEFKGRVNIEIVKNPRRLRITGTATERAAALALVNDAAKGLQEARRLEEQRKKKAAMATLERQIAVQQDKVKAARERMLEAMKKHGISEVGGNPNAPESDAEPAEGALRAAKRISTRGVSGRGKNGNTGDERQ